MSQAADLSPAQDSTNETETITFDFGPTLAARETISSVVLMLCKAVVNPAKDPAPASRLIGSYVIGQSPNTNAANAAVLQRVGTMIGGVTYQLQCVVYTSSQQQLELRVNLPCVATP